MDPPAQTMDVKYGSRDDREMVCRDRDRVGNCFRRISTTGRHYAKHGMIGER